MKRISLLTFVFIFVFPSILFAQRWVSRTSMPSAKRNLTASAVSDKVYALGGLDNDYNYTQDVYEYDPGSDSWSSKTSMPELYYYLKSTVINDTIYVVGWDLSNTSVLAYDPAGDSWVTKTATSTNRSDYCIASVNGKIYVFGGFGDNGYLNTVEEYDPSADSWTAKTSMPTALMGAAAAVYNDKIYIVGGEGDSGNSDELFVYDPALDSWTSKTSMPTPRRNLEAGIIDDMLYALGGYHNNAFTDVMEEFDLRSETWTTSDSMLTPRESFGSTVANSRIYAVGGIGGSPSVMLSVNEEFFPGSPNIPSGLTASADDDVVYLEWNTGSDADILQYNIYRSTTDGFNPAPSDSIGRTFAPDTIYTDNTVQNYTTYYYRIAALDSSHNLSNYSEQVSAYPQDTTAPAVPQNLSVVPGDNKDSLSWDANTEDDLYYYIIYRNLSPGFNPTPSDSVNFVLHPGTTYIDSNLINGTTYYYKISVRDSFGNESSFSDEVSGTPVDLIAPDAPQNLTASGFNESIRLEWNTSTEEDLYLYKIYRSLSDGFTPQPTDSIAIILKPDTVFIDSGLNPGVKYYYKISAFDSSLNESSFSNQAHAVPTDTVAPGAPQNLTVTPGERFLDLSWAANTEDDLSYYVIYRSKSGGFSPSSSDSLTLIFAPDSTYRDSTVTVDTTYYYRISAVDTAFNESDYSTEASGAPYDSVTPAAPQYLTATPGHLRIFLNWAPNQETDLLKYTVYRSTSPGFSPTPAESLTVVFAPDTAMTDSSVFLNTTYYYRISASDSFGNESDFSSEVNSAPDDTLAPAAPQNLITSSGDKQVSLTWYTNTEPDVREYVVYRSLNNGFSPTADDIITTITKPDTSYTDYSVFNNQTYYYLVAAVDSFDNYSSPSNQATGTPAPNLDYTWQTKASMNNERRGPVSGTIDGRIYTIGGRDGTGIITYNAEYDPETNSWASKTALPTSREKFGGAVLNGELYIVGGRTNGTRYTTVEAYDPSTNTWDTKGSLNEERRDLVVAEAGGKLYAIGGRLNDNQELAYNEEYDPVGDAWILRTAITTARYGMGVATVNGKIYVIGGGVDASVISTVEEYNPSTDGWAAKTSMPTARRFLTATVINDKIYCIGGETAAGEVDSVEIYDPATDTWFTGDSMLTARSEQSASAVNNVKIYVIGGYDGSSQTAANEEYNPPPWAPANLSAAQVGLNINLSWTANTEPDLKYYLIYRSTTDDFTPTVNDIIGEAERTATSFADTSFSIATTYYYKISAVDSAGHEGNPSSQASITTANLGLMFGLADTLVTNGDTLRIPLSFYGILDGEGINTFQFKLEFDSTMLEGIDIDTSGFGNPVTIISNAAPGEFNVAAYSENELTGTNKSMTVIFRVSDDAMRDTAYIQFAEAYFNEGSPTMDTSSVRIRVKPRYGDVTGDGTISAYDASYVLQYVVGLMDFSASQLEKGDVTYNGTVSTYDAYYIILRVTEAISSFPVEDSLFAKRSRAGLKDIAVNLMQDINIDNNEFVLKLDINAPKSFSSLYFDLNFDKSILNYENFALNSRYSDYLWAENTDNGRLRIALAGYSDAKSTGEIITLRFGIKETENILPENLVDIRRLEFNDIFIDKETIGKETTGLPTKFDLAQNYPNPFNGETTIKYQLPKAANVTLKIYNILGQEVRTLVSANKKAGFYNVKWDGLNDIGIKTASGVYIYRIKAGEFNSVRKMVFLK